MGVEKKKEFVKRLGEELLKSLYRANLNILLYGLRTYFSDSARQIISSEMTVKGSVETGDI